MDLRRAYSLLLGNLTLKSGMVIITGTLAGTAWSGDKELGGKGVDAAGPGAGQTRYCLPGDIVECEVEKIRRSALTPSRRPARGP